MFQKSIEEVISELKSDFENGLSSDQVEENLKKYGKNQLVEKEKDPLYKKIINQLKDPLIIVLLIASLVSIIVDPHEWVDSLIIVIVVTLNAILGVYQENSAEKSLEALKNMSAPNAKVIRNGKLLQIPSNEVVVGDIVELEAGDAIASDGRVIASYQLQVDESALTGESLPVQKNTEVIEDLECPLGDQKNMVFASTVCTYGRGCYIVTSVGMQNEVGKIASMLMNAEKETTPLQIKLAQISKTIGIMCLAICIIVFGLEIFSGLSILESFKTAVALAVAAIPEGLATVVTIVLSIGVTKMVQQHAIVRKLPAVETLGSASVVCSDKTGTLTQNKMTVVKTYQQNTGIQPFQEDNSNHEKELLRYFTLCSDAQIKFENDKKIQIGDPTEIAMVEASLAYNETKQDLEKTYPRVGEIAFDSSRKMMTVIVKNGNSFMSITKGAPDVIFARSTQVQQKILTQMKPWHYKRYVY